MTCKYCLIFWSKRQQPAASARIKRDLLELGVLFFEAFHAPYLCATTPMYREEGEISVAPFFLDHKNAPPLFGLWLCCCLYHHQSKHRTRSNICDGPQQNRIKVITSTQLRCCKEQTHWIFKKCLVERLCWKMYFPLYLWWCH